MTTRELENSIYFSLKKMGTYLCFEVSMPEKYRGGLVTERVDLLSYDTKGDWKFYELKVSKSDFYSKNKVTFKGNLNYYVLPEELYEKVKADIPHGIGVYVARDYGNRYINGRYFCECVKRAKRQPLGVNEELLRFNFMQALSREYAKYRKILKNETERIEK